MDQDLLRANLEALLFVCEEPQNLRRLAEAIPDATKQEVQEALDALMREYAVERFGIQVVEIAGGYQMCTKATYAASINKLFERRRKRSLSKPGLETLAIVAYRQPITRAEIEAIRGVNVDGAIHTLLDRRLIKIAGRKEVAGRPFLYRTTKSFLHCFGLKSLSDLPKVDDIAQGLQPLEQAEEQPQLWDQAQEDQPLSSTDAPPVPIEGEDDQPPESTPTES